jgi:hypothetical protein
MTAWWGGLSPPTRMVFKMTGGLVVIGSILYAITGIQTTQAHAFDIATGTASPYMPRTGVPGVLLAIVGYLFAPAIAGTILAAVLDRTQRDRAPGLEDSLEKLRPHISAEVDRHLDARGVSSPTQEAPTDAGGQGQKSGPERERLQ